MKYLTLGINIAAGMAIFTFLGYWFDQKQETEYGVMIGACFGLVYMFYEIWKVVRDTNNKS
ncbi:MAG: AtpZ/AtpI family protein [Candidatus Omnitrophica bacterium]|nr:AtpZ/AtpI family protein [Candidatus Omnitrophota bacterium]MCA9406398.1 AtpZ/AtpI family protein [Candidatus Omnitrophota bacterium]